MVKENGERPDVRVQEFALDIHIGKTTPELMSLSTYELLFLLKAIRKERSDMYHHMNTFYKARQTEQTDRFNEYEQISEKDYLYYTKKAFVVENLILTRLGYVPIRITETYLAQYLSNIKKAKKGPMVIRKERQQKTT